MNQLNLMKLVAYKTVDTYVKSNSVVVLGTGRTSCFAVERLGELLKSKTLDNVLAVATSNKTYDKANELGIPLATLDEVLDSGRSIDIAIDGADAVDKDLNLIKGGGGAAFNEYLIEQYAKELMVDESKLTEGHLLEKFPLPVELFKNSHVSTSKLVYNKFKDYILNWNIRKNDDGSLFLTDNNNVIMDVQFKPTSLHDLNRDLKMVHGVVCNGLFLNMVTRCLVARSDNTVYTLEKK